MLVFLNFIHTYERLCYAGYRPLSLFDVRSRGDDIVIVDFGSDLGAPRHLGRPHNTSQQAQTDLMRIVGTALDVSR